MQFRILGPLEVGNAVGAIPLGGVKPRAVLAVLLLHANEPVSAERLAMALWGEDVPNGAVKTVQVHVSRLRKALADPDLLTTTPAGYCLHLEPGQLDAEQFEQLVAQGMEVRDADPERAADLLREALGLWRGPPLADLASEPFAAIEIARLEEQRLAALEARVDADLAAGRHPALVGELQQLLAEHPRREGLAARLMVALYRCGRQQEALETYSEVRRVLVSDVGLEPGPELRRVHEAILRQDPALERPEPPELPAELDPRSDMALAGRDGELAWLQEHWDAARAGAGRIVSIVGEPGAGKTRLAAELARSVHGRGYPVLYGSGKRAKDVIVKALTAKRPTLLVLDDFTPPDVGSFAAVPLLTVVTGATPGPGSEMIRLEPLDRHAVREIARTYAADPALDSERLLHESHGNARRVHQLAGRWAREEAAQRLERVAEEAEVRRETLHSLESQLAGSVVELQAATDRATRLDDGGSRVVCPFKGLASFEPADAPYFFGREQLVADVVARLVGAPLVGVIGASGSGKSSVVKAGLMPALAAGTLPGSRDWAQAVFRPGRQPLRALRDAFSELDPDRRFVLVVDQFEETFTVCTDKAHRAEFLAELVELTHDDRRPGQIVLAIRADQYARCAENADLARLLARHQVLVGPMDADELCRAIEGPAERAGLLVERKLTNALIKDVDEQPGALPLLSTALLELWQHRSGRRLTHAAYERTGGVSGAVARLAEDAFSELGEDEQRVAHDVMMELVVETGDDVVERRRVSRAELRVDERDDVAAVVEALTGHRLLTASEGTIEVAHEALLREWPRLRQWIEDDRERMRVERKLIDAAGEWEASERDDDLLYGRVRLTPADYLAERGLLHLGDSERAFLDASRARVQRDRQARRRRLTVVFSALAVALVAIMAIAIVAVNRGRDAEHQRSLAVSRELALESGTMLDSDPELGLRLALWADETAPTDEAAKALRQAVLAYHQLASLPADDVDANAASYSPDGKRVVTGGTDGVARVWDPATERAVATLPPDHGALLSARYSPRGAIALGFEDGTLLVTDGSLRAARELRAGDDDVAVNRVAFSGDGSRLAAGLGDGTVLVFGKSGEPEIRLSGHADAVTGVALDADGHRVVSAGADGKVLLWDATPGAQGRLLHDGAENVVEFSPDGTRVLGVGDDRRVRLWDASTGTAVRNFDGQGRQLYAAAFSQAGSRIATGGIDGVIRVWSVAGGPPLIELRGQRGRILDVGFAPRGARVVSAGDDGTARTWDAGDALAWSVPGNARSIDFAPDGHELATAGDDGIARVYDATSGALRRQLKGPSGYSSAVFAPTDDRLAIGYDSAARIRVWPVGGGDGDTTVQLEEGSGFNSARFDPAGKRIVYADALGRLAVRDLATGREVELRGGPKDLYVYDLSFSGDGKRVAVVAEQAGVLVWRIDRSQRPERELKGYRGHANAMAYAADGRIITGGADRTVRVWPARGNKAIVMPGHTDEVTTVAISRGGDRILSTSSDGTLRLWDARRGGELAVLQTTKEPFRSVMVSRDGRLATLDSAGNIKVFDCEVCGSLADVRTAARALKPRALTPGERERFQAAAG